MRTDCKKLVVQCARNKPSRHRPYGLLQPLQVPGRPWHSISMDVIEQLPASNPTTDTVTAPDVTDAFVSHVFSRHGIPLHVADGIRPSPLPFIRLPPSNAPTLHARPLPLSQRSGRTGQQHLGTAPSYVLRLRAGQLVYVVLNLLL